MATRTLVRASTVLILTTLCSCGQEPVSHYSTNWLPLEETNALSEFLDTYGFTEANDMILQQEKSRFSDAGVTLQVFVKVQSPDEFRIIRQIGDGNNPDKIKITSTCSSSSGQKTLDNLTAELTDGL